MDSFIRLREKDSKKRKKLPKKEGYSLLENGYRSKRKKKTYLVNLTLTPGTPGCPGLPIGPVGH